MIKASRKALLLLSLSILLLGCKSPAPDITVKLEESNGEIAKALVYLSEDNNSVYRAAVSKDDEGVFEQYDLQGNRLSSFDLPINIDAYDFKLLEASDDSSYIVSGTLQNLLFIDPSIQSASVVPTQDLTQGQNVKVVVSHINSNDHFVFSGSLLTDAGGGEFVIGLVSPEGSVRKLQTFPNAQAVSLQKIKNSDEFLLFVSSSDEEDNVSTVVTRMTEQLDAIDTHTIPDRSIKHLSLAVSDTLYFLQGVTYDFSGNIVRTSNVYHLFDQLWGEEGFYTSSFTPVIWYVSGYWDICRYDFEFNQQWCHRVEKKYVAPMLISKKITADDSLLTAFDYWENQYVGIEVSDGGTDLYLKKSTTIRYTKFDAEGHITWKANENPFYIRGLSDDGRISEITSEDKHGVENHFDTVLLPGDKFFSSNADGNGLHHISIWSYR